LRGAYFFPYAQDTKSSAFFGLYTFPFDVALTPTLPALHDFFILDTVLFYAYIFILRIKAVYLFHQEGL